MAHIFSDPNSNEKVSDEITRKLIFDCIYLIMEKRNGAEFAREAIMWWRTNTEIDGD